MKILFLPYNIASQQAILSEHLNSLNGIESKYIVSNEDKYNSSSSARIILKPEKFSKRNPFKSVIKTFIYHRKLKGWIRWADIVHYVWGTALPNGKDLEWSKKFNKTIFIEWVGSDIRDPDKLRRINPFFENALKRGYEYFNEESSNYKIQIQNQFSKAKAIPTVIPEMAHYVNKMLFDKIIILPQRINTKLFTPNYPSIKNKKPIIVHSPTRIIAKGSDLIERTLKELEKELDFEYKIVNGLERSENLQIIQNCDVFIDQIIVGGYGMAACEAMAFGKPVIAFILEGLYNSHLPNNLPIWKTDQDNLKIDLKRIIENANLRNEIGKLSRKFVEDYHDVEKISKSLLLNYKNELSNKL
jgi:glycosyltransferase involved in cell wall biosynthesis